MKVLKNILLAASLLTLGSCKDFLDENPTGFFKHRILMFPAQKLPGLMQIQVMFICRVCLPDSLRLTEEIPGIYWNS
jgi:hypothetical protein